MIYEFKIEKKEKFDRGNFATETEAFESAVSCSATSVESILSDYSVVVGCVPPSITITSENEMPFTLDECSELVKGAFQSQDGNSYPEFAKVTKVIK